MRRPRGPRLGRLRPGEMPGIRYDTRPWATIALVVASVAVGVAWQAGAVPLSALAVLGLPAQEWWRLLTSLFAYDNQGYLFCALGAIGLFGWLLERRHGALGSAGRVRAGRRRGDGGDGGRGAHGRRAWAATGRRWDCSAPGWSPTCASAAGAARPTPTCSAWP